jgi:hypothetical protein
VHRRVQRHSAKGGGDIVSDRSRVEKQVLDPSAQAALYRHVEASTHRKECMGAGGAEGGAEAGRGNVRRLTAVAPAGGEIGKPPIKCKTHPSAKGAEVGDLIRRREGADGDGIILIRTLEIDLRPKNRGAGLPIEAYLAAA